MKSISKGENPVSRLQDERISPFIRVYFESNHLKQLFRQGWLIRGISKERCESVAEHSFGVALLAMFLADSYAPDLDLQKILKLALIHDFGEIYAGDIVPQDQVSPLKKHELEKRSVHQVFKTLPHGETYIEAWQEYEINKSPEARFVRQIDRLEMALQATVYKSQDLAADLTEFLDTAEADISLPELQDICRNLRALFNKH